VPHASGICRAHVTLHTGKLDTEWFYCYWQSIEKQQKHCSKHILHDATYQQFLEQFYFTLKITNNNTGKLSEKGTEQKQSMKI
jgi:hypothetical protein